MPLTGLDLRGLVAGCGGCDSTSVHPASGSAASSASRGRAHGALALRALADLWRRARPASSRRRGLGARPPSDASAPPRARPAGRRPPKRRYSAGSTKRLGGRRDESAEDDDRHRVHDLQTGRVPMTTNGSITSGRAGAASAPARAAPARRAHQFAAPKLSPSALQILEVADQQHAVSGGEPEQRQEAEQRAERQLCAVDQRCQRRRRPARPAGVRKARAPGRQLRKAACRSRKTGITAAIANAEHARGADLLAGALLQHLRVVLEREADARPGGPRCRRRPRRGCARSTPATMSRWRETASR